MNISRYKDKTIAVLMGGLSSEKEISIRSGENVCRGLKNCGLNVVPVEVGRDAAYRIAEAKPDIAFIALHGVYGEDGCIQGMLEVMGIPYTFSGPVASGIAMDKLLTKKILKASDIPIPDFVDLSHGNHEGLADDIDSKLGFPVILKPNCEGSSIGVELIHSRAELDEMLKDYLIRFPYSFAEQYIKGREVTVGVLGKGSDLTVFPILELRPKHEFYDYETKYTEGMTDFIIPAELSPDMTQSVKDMAAKSYRFLGLKGVARIDFMIDDNGMYALEANTIPGMTDTSDIPAMAKAIGMPFEELMVKILDCVDL